MSFWESPNYVIRTTSAQPKCDSKCCLCIAQRSAADSPNLQVLTNPGRYKSRFNERVVDSLYVTINSLWITRFWRADFPERTIFWSVVFTSLRSSMDQFQNGGSLSFPLFSFRQRGGATFFRFTSTVLPHFSNFPARWKNQHFLYCFFLLFLLFIRGRSNILIKYYFLSFFFLCNIYINF